MNQSLHISNHFKGIYFGGNWTCSNLKDQLADVTWQEASTKIASLNTIITLAYHINYFVEAVTKVLDGQPLNANDKFSFDHPPINSENDWNNFRNKIFSDGEKFASLIEKFPQEKLENFLAEEKYGTYYRNLHGIIEHSHYHLGQIAVIKKLIREQNVKS